MRLLGGMAVVNDSSMCERYLTEIGVRPSPRATCPFDPGYAPATLEGHMQQSGHLMGTVKISMACWMVADETATRRKIRAVTEITVFLWISSQRSSATTSRTRSHQARDSTFRRSIMEMSHGR